MAWHGVEAVDDAVDATRGFLLPVAVGRWARVAALSLFVGSGRLAGGVANAVEGVGVDAPPASAEAVEAVVALRPGRALAALTPAELVALAGVVLLSLGAVVVGAAFEFVLVDAIGSDSLRLVDGLRDHLVDGLRYLGFLVGLAAASVVPPAAAVAAVAAADVEAAAVVGSPLAVVGLVVASLAYLLAVWLAVRLTREFVVPAMVADGCGVVDGWQRVWSGLRGQLRQLVAYLLAHAVVAAGVSLVGAALVAVVGVVAAILVVTGWLVVVLAGGSVGPALAGTVETDARGAGLAAGAALLLLVGLPVRALTLTYLRSYELAALGRFAPGLDLVGRYRPADAVDGDRLDVGVDDEEREADDGNGDDRDGIDDDSDDLGGTDDDAGGGVDGGSRPENENDGDDGDGDDGDDGGFGGFVPADPKRAPADRDGPSDSDGSDDPSDSDGSDDSERSDGRRSGDE